jgi:hypothetical protein
MEPIVEMCEVEDMRLYIVIKDEGFRPSRQQHALGMCMKRKLYWAVVA